MRITGFVWLEQYVEKLAWKHDVTPAEVEAMFFASPTYRLVEKGHIRGENMHSAMGQTERVDTSSPSSFTSRTGVH